jgi:hypothetical protein
VFLTQSVGKNPILFRSYSGNLNSAQIWSKTMFKRCLIATMLVSTLTAFSQDDPRKPEVSKTPLSPEQIYVYRAVLAEYVKSDPTASMNIANRTEPFGSGGFLDDNDDKCIARFKGPRPTKLLTVHQLSGEVPLSPKMILVDPDRQSALVKQNDPQQLIDRDIDGHEALSDKDLDESVTQAFATGLFTFSEIVFDKRHKYALVQYSFWCGSLCGSGELLVLKNRNGKWFVNKRCGGWVS